MISENLQQFIDTLKAQLTKAWAKVARLEAKLVDYKNDLQNVRQMLDEAGADKAVLTVALRGLVYPGQARFNAEDVMVCWHCDVPFKTPYNETEHEPDCRWARAAAVLFPDTGKEVQLRTVPTVGQPLGTEELTEDAEAGQFLEGCCHAVDVVHSHDYVVGGPGKMQCCHQHVEPHPSGWRGR